MWVDAGSDPFAKPLGDVLGHVAVRLPRPRDPQPFADLFQHPCVHEQGHSPPYHVRRCIEVLAQPGAQQVTARCVGASGDGACHCLRELGIGALLQQVDQCAELTRQDGDVLGFGRLRAGVHRRVESRDDVGDLPVFPRCDTGIGQQFAREDMQPVRSLLPGAWRVHHAADGAHRGAEAGCARPLLSSRGLEAALLRQ